MTLTFKGSQKKRVLYHLLFWVTFITGFTLVFSTKYGYEKSFQAVALESLAYAIPIYINLLLLIPGFLMKKRYLEYGLGLLFTLVLTVPLHLLIDYYNFWSSEEGVQLQLLALQSLINILMLLAVTTGIKFLLEWYNQQQRNQELEKERLQAELKFLKSQINPHFLFNTLNNLYSLSLKKSDKAPEMILKLAEMMRYLLYESNEKLVPLVNEIRCMENYIELERIRQDERTQINVEINCPQNGKMIAPLLFIPFLENSFKHGVNSNLEAGWINVKLNETQDALFFEIENNKPSKSVKKGKESGIGLQNVRRRLELIYPGKHELTITDADSYKTNLKILLS